MTPAAVIAWFDSLPPAVEADMLGRWSGEEVPTGHPMDGLLYASYWSGKRFEGPDAVFPLVHTVPIWGERCVNPALLPLRLITAFPARDTLLRLAFPLIAPLFFTRKPPARLRMMRFRGRDHAAMIYDGKPIQDLFAKIDADTILGWMDQKGAAQPYFFKLIRVR